MSRLLKFFVLFLGLSGCEEVPQTPELFGQRAGAAERAYGTFGDVPDAHAKTFMKNWHASCVLAKEEMQGSPFLDSIGEDAYNMTEANTKFSQAYVDELKLDPRIAAQKPLQRHVVTHWWKSGTGCANILRETPAWALE